MVCGLAASLCLFFLANGIGGKLISNVYLSEHAVHERNLDTIRAFQQYIDERDLSSRDTDEIAYWTIAQEDIYILLYQNQRLALEAGWWGVDAEEQYGTDDLQDIPDASIYPVSFRDGVLQAVVYDFSETELYDIVLMVSLALAFCLFAAILLLYNRRITRAIVSLSQDIHRIGEGELHFELEAKGNDELAALRRSVDAMRRSILKKTRAEQEAKEKNSELITAMSHDIRNPLTALLGYLDLARSEKQDDTPMGKYLDASYEKALQLRHLTDELFRYTLVFGGGQIPMQMESYDATILIEQLLSEQEADLSARAITVQSAVAPLHGQVRVDVQYFKRVLDNLFDNVRKYAEPTQPVCLAATEENGRLCVMIDNIIAKQPNVAQSNKIGLKTCQKVMAQMEGTFTTHIQNEHFCAELSLPLYEGNEET